ncbi:MAG: amidohydrolase family protein [Betaproteobacteria bacterium]|nr:amidohydrolase family protein [Betaproteobacteria bacterium]
MHDVVIRGASPWGTRHAQPVDVAVDGAAITSVAASISESGGEEWHVGGRLLLPALVDPHHHLDKACLADRLGAASDLADARARFGELRPHLTREDLQQRGERVIRWAIQHGVAALRTHADVDAIVGLRHVEAALALREAFADRIEIQVVAFQPAGVALSDEASWQKLEDALRLGCEAVGGTTGSRGREAPALMERMLQVAERTGRRVDLHLDETLDPAVQNLAELARLTSRHGLQGRVVASHCCSLSVAAPAQRAEAIRLAAEASVHVISLPLSNLYLQGRDSGLRGLAPVAELLAGGVNVACGSDNVQDPFLPAGNADPLLAAQTLGLAAHIADPRYLLEAVSFRAARAIGLSASADWCRPGAPARFALADCGMNDDPVASLAPRPLVVFNGRVVRRPGDSACDLPPLRAPQKE